MCSPSLASLANSSRLDEKYRPFARNDDYGTCGWHGPKLTVREYTRVIVRGFAMSIIFFTVFLTLTVSSFLLKDDNRLARFWSRWLPLFMHAIVYYVAGFSILVVNEKGEEQTDLPFIPEASVLVCNHVGYWDIPILLEAFEPTFVAAESVQDVPIIGRIAKILGTIFVKHPNKIEKNKSSATFLISRLQWLTKQRNEKGENNTTRPIVIFPEGTTTNGSYLLPFRTGAFAAGVPIQPIHLEFPFRRLNPAWESIGFWRHILFFFAQPSHEATVTILPPLMPHNDAAKFANEARTAIAQSGNLQLTDMVYRDKRDYHRALMKQGCH